MDGGSFDVEHLYQPNEHTEYHEVCFAENEEGLYRAYTNCPKNPGHKAFIPISEFTMEHLPEKHRNSLFLQLVQTLAALTVCLDISAVSKRRPKTYEHRVREFPLHHLAGEGAIHRGTGRISEVCIHELKCECQTCQKLPHPKTPYAIIEVSTASHVVFDRSEAEKTTCLLFYDNDDKRKARQLSSFNEVFTLLGARTDYTHMSCRTTDMKLAHQLHDCLARFEALDKKIRDTVSQKDDMVIIVSHPHGRGKRVTIGDWISTQRVWEFEEIKDFTVVTDGAFVYNAATCPGSSGAYVWYLNHYEDDDYKWCHSNGTDKNVVNRGTLTGRHLADRELWQEAKSSGLDLHTYMSIVWELISKRFCDLQRASSLENWIQYVKADADLMKSDEGIFKQIPDEVIKPQNRDGCQKFALEVRNRLRDIYDGLQPSLEQLMKAIQSGAISDVAARFHPMLFIWFDRDMDGKLDKVRLEALLNLLHGQLNLLRKEEMEHMKDTLSKRHSDSGHISLTEYTCLMLNTWQHFPKEAGGGEEKKLKDLLHKLLRAWSEWFAW